MAAQFDVCRLSDQTLVVLLQSDIIDILRTRLVAPLVPIKKAGRVIKGLNPQVEVAEQIYVLMPQLSASLPATELTVHVGSTAYMRDDIIRSLDLLFTGF